jgi:hypothetical protein
VRRGEEVRERGAGKLLASGCGAERGREERLGADTHNAVPAGERRDGLVVHRLVQARVVEEVGPERRAQVSTPVAHDPEVVQPAGQLRSSK